MLSLSFLRERIGLIYVRTWLRGKLKIARTGWTSVCGIAVNLRYIFKLGSGEFSVDRDREGKLKRGWGKKKEDSELGNEHESSNTGEFEELACNARLSRRSLVFPSTFILYYNSIRHGECRIRDRQARLSMCSVGRTCFSLSSFPRVQLSFSLFLLPRTCSWL